MKGSILNNFLAPFSKEDKIRLAADALDLQANEAFRSVFLELERRAVNIIANLEADNIDGHHNICLYIKCLASIKNYFNEFVNFAKEEHAKEQLGRVPR